jgi:acyl-CoA thioester hydrolase
MSFTTTRRVDFGDTDMAGIMHFANFFRFMESAEIDFLHSIGMTVSWREGGVKWGFPRVSAACDYKKPARFEDVLTIAVTVEKLSAKTVSYRFDFSNQKGEPLAVGRITSVFCRSDGPDHLESVEMTPEMRRLLKPGEPAASAAGVV